MDSNDPRITVWATAQQTAAHFNELLLKIRIQGMAFLVGSLAWIHTRPIPLSDHPLACLTLAIAIGWLLVAAMDLHYYGRLLRGAVDQLLSIEKGDDFVQLALSSSIKRWVVFDESEDGSKRNTTVTCAKHLPLYFEESLWQAFYTIPAGGLLLYAGLLILPKEFEAAKLAVVLIIPAAVLWYLEKTRRFFKSRKREKPQVSMSTPQPTPGQGGLS